MALSSSDGLLWGNGPMRVGGLGSTDCLSPGSMFVPNQFFFIVCETILKYNYHSFFLKKKDRKEQQFPWLLGQVSEA